MCNLTLAMGRTGADRPKFNSIHHEPFLHRVREQLRSAVGLNALNVEAHLLNDGIQEVDGVLGRSAGIRTQDTTARSIIERCVLKHTCGDLADVHLDAFTANRSNVALTAFATRRPFQRLYGGLGQYLMSGG